MEVLRTSEARRFSRQRPTHVALFDRPRIVSDLLCLEPDQAELPRHYPASDAFYLVLEGRAHVEAGGQSADLDAQDAVLVPPGVDHRVSNRGPGRVTLLAVVGPKPTRAEEVRLPRPLRPSGARPESPERRPATTGRAPPTPPGRGSRPTITRGRGQPQGGVRRGGRPGGSSSAGRTGPRGPGRNGPRTSGPR